MKYSNIREEELKNSIAQDYFKKFDCNKILGNVDFCVAIPIDKKQETLLETQSLLWAEAKAKSSNIHHSIVQLILTIGKARTFDKALPPAYLGAFDTEKIAFIAYNTIHEIFYQSDFNWNVTPSNHKTKEFKIVLRKVEETLETNSFLFYFDRDDEEINLFIEKNFIEDKSDTSKIRVDKNNFMVIYNKWLENVKSSIAVDWGIAKKNNIIDGDFYLADLLSKENESIKDKLFVLLKTNHYILDRKFRASGMFSSTRTDFKDKQKAHNLFWNKYERPPKEEYWDYIVKRRDLLVPQDVRERKGSYFTPRIWVELSQQYLTDVLGEDWQDEYYVWDCAAGTGNLLNGLTNKYNIWASTLDKQDVDVMKDRIKNGANLLENHVFQFDFLNDEFSKLPQPLQDIINNPEKRKKLVVYINPPYAETATKNTKDPYRINKRLVSFTKVQKENSFKIGIATKELFAQFLIRIYFEITGCVLAEFSKLKILQGPNFYKFRNHFIPKFLNGFIVPANTFDNVKGQFPIGFKIWDTNKKEKFKQANINVFDKNAVKLDSKTFYAYSKGIFITDWYKKYHKRDIDNSVIGSVGLYGSDFQHNNFIVLRNYKSHPNRYTFITKNNLLPSSIYFSVRHCIPATWLNDRDQFVYPNASWEGDIEFQNDCLTFTLFHGQNRISSKEGTNYWIPFTEEEVNAKEKFESNCMTNFIQGKLKPQKTKAGEEVPMGGEISSEVKLHTTPLEFSTEAKNVFDAGRALWGYYHKQPKCNVNASFYDIRAHFQGRNEKGRMNSKSDDETYMTLINHLREKLKVLAKKIEPKVYEHSFLKR